VWASRSDAGPPATTVDPALAVSLDDSHVRVSIESAALAASCTDHSVRLEIDGHWFALCGQPTDARDIAIGIELGAGEHELVLHHGTRRSPTLVKRAEPPLKWIDILVVVGYSVTSNTTSIRSLTASWVETFTSLKPNAATRCLLATSAVSLNS
jgi:hypothetical protein